MFGNAKIYRIVNDANDNIFIGSTTDSLDNRFRVFVNANLKLCSMKAEPKFRKIKNKLSKLSVAIDIIGIEHFHIELLQSYPCTDFEELHLYEGRMIEKYNSKERGYNSLMPFGYEEKNIPNFEVTCDICHALILSREYNSVEHSQKTIHQRALREIGSKKFADKSPFFVAEKKSPEKKQLQNKEDIIEKLERAFLSPFAEGIALSILKCDKVIKSDTEPKIVQLNIKRVRSEKIEKRNLFVNDFRTVLYEKSFDLS
jgi:GTPase SAR1 family protein